MYKRLFFTTLLFVFIANISFSQNRPNVIFILTDDLGYGDLSCYGATKIHTPNVDAIAANGVRFTNGHCTSGTCTPSRFAVMTGTYPWRKQGTGILPGDAALIIPTDKPTLPKVFQQAGYTTGIVGKWHLGLGTTVEKNWNARVFPGPDDVGFDYSFIFPATADRVPTIFLENQETVDLDAEDPITVSYKQKIGNDPTGLEHPELLKMKSSPGQGHNQTIVNGIGRIGYMSGGKTARWADEEVGLAFLTKAKMFVEKSAAAKKPFFLYYAMTEPHVPRMPATIFKGRSGLGFRGDAILQMDYAVGELMKTLKHLGIDKNTIVIFSSDNGPVLDDGYQDGAVTMLNGHKQAGSLRGGKYSVLEGGTRVPFIVSWPGKIKSGSVSNALVCQMDFLASFAAFLKVPVTEKLDSKNTFAALTGTATKGRDILIEQGSSQLAIVKDNWKYIPPNNGPAMLGGVDIESGNSMQPQLYNLANDKEEKNNLAGANPGKVKELAALLESLRILK